VLGKGKAVEAWEDLQAVLMHVIEEREGGSHGCSPRAVRS